MAPRPRGRGTDTFVIREAGAATLGYAVIGAASAAVTVAFVIALRRAGR